MLFVIGAVIGGFIGVFMAQQGVSPQTTMWVGGVVGVILAIAMEVTRKQVLESKEARSPR